MSETLQEVDEIAKTIPEVAPPGWGHTVAKKEKTKPNKPKSKIGGSAHEFQKDLDSGKFKGLPGDKTKADKKASMFKLMWSMKNKGDKPHYKPGVKDKLKSQYKEEVEESNLPPHLSKFLDKKGNPNKEAQARIDAGRRKREVAARTKDVTPKGYGPSEEVEMDEARPSADHPWRSTPQKRIQRKSDLGKYGARVAAKRRTKGPIGGGKVPIPGMNKEEVEEVDEVIGAVAKGAAVVGKGLVKVGTPAAKIAGRLAVKGAVAGGKAAGRLAVKGAKAAAPHVKRGAAKVGKEVARVSKEVGSEVRSQAADKGKKIAKAGGRLAVKGAKAGGRLAVKGAKGVSKIGSKTTVHHMKGGRPSGKIEGVEMDEWGDTSILSKQSARIAGRPDIGSMDNKPHRKLKITQKGLDALRADRDRPKVKTQVKLTKKGRAAIKDDVSPADQKLFKTIDKLTPKSLRPKVMKSRGRGEKIADEVETEGFFSGKTKGRVTKSIFNDPAFRKITGRKSLADIAKKKKEQETKKEAFGLPPSTVADKDLGDKINKEHEREQKRRAKIDAKKAAYKKNIEYDTARQAAKTKHMKKEGRFASPASDPRIGGSSSVDTVPDFALKAKKGATSAPGSGSIAKAKKAKASDVNKSIEQQMADAMKEDTWSKNFKAKAAERRGETKRRREAERDSPGQRVPPKQKDEDTNRFWHSIKEAQWKVKLRGLPTFYMPGKSRGEIRQMLRKQLKRPMDDIEDVTRATPAAKKKDFRTRAQGKDSAVVSGKS